MAKVLNLDELQKEERVLKLKGKTHVMKETSVQDFIDTAKLIEDMEKSGEKLSIAQEMELTKDMIMRRFPTVDESEIGGLSVKMLRAVVEFMNQGDIAESEEATETEKKPVE